MGMAAGKVVALERSRARVDSRNLRASGGFLTKGSIFAVQGDVVREFGFLAAAFLQRVYYLQTSRDTPQGVRIRVDKTAELLGCSERGLWKAIRNLTGEGVLEQRRARAGAVSTFRVDADRVRARSSTLVAGTQFRQ